jgi:OmpA-OmpF porin, OOP family
MKNTTVVKGIAVFFLASVCAFAASGDKAEVKGMISTRTGETLIVKTADGNVTIVLTDDTTTKDDKGLFGLDKQRMSNVVLIPGLKVDVDGRSDEQGRVVAKTITVDGDDLETSEMIEAGLHPTAEQVAANVQAIAANQQRTAANQQDIASNQVQLAAQKENIASNQQQIAANISAIEANANRFTALSDYDVKGEATVNFKVGSSDISATAAMNTKLSEDRAKAVITYLFQQGGVPIRHIVAPGAMGEYGAAAPNETKAGRAENRRVEVKILVNKGIAGS